MILTDILSSERVRVAPRGANVQSKDDALRALAALLGAGSSSSAKRFNRRVSVTASPSPTAPSKTCLAKWLHS